MNRFPSSDAILPTGQYVDLHDLASAPFGADGLVFHVFKKGNSLRAVSGSGGQAYLTIGNGQYFHHDQSRRDMGRWTLVGWVTEVATGGDVPTRKLPLSVYK